MTLEAQVREALERNKPGEALLILARAFDEQIAHPPMVVQGTEPDWSIPAELDEPEPSDPRDRLAWEARRNLAKDAGRVTPDIGVAESRVTTVSTGPDSVEVAVPAAPQEVLEQREELASFELGLARGCWWSRPELALSATAAISAYVKGGPLWLHAYDRDFVIGLPRHLRVAMVQDLETHAPDDAHALARDILKDQDPTSTLQINLEAQGHVGVE